MSTPLPRWTHNKTGNVYEVVGLAIDATNATNGRKMVVYQRNGVTYVRETAEFHEKFTPQE